MSYYDDIIDNEPARKELEFGGKKKAVWFRRLTAGERLNLNSGQKMTFGDGSKGAMEMDLGDVSRNRHKLVQYANVTEDGSQVFAKLSDVQALPDALVDKLSKLANEVNGDEDEPPKS